MTDETSAPEQPAPEQQAVEAEARSQGWRPKDEFQGEGWVDAPTFIQRGREILPIVQSQNRRLRDEQARTKSELDAVKQTLKDFAEFHKGVEQRAYHQAMEKLKADRHAAILAGEGEEQVRIEKQMEVVHQQSQQVTGPKVHEPEVKTAAVSEEMEEWQAKHTWFGPDRVKTGIAMAEGEALQAEQPDLVGRPFLRELDRRLLVNYPGKFGPPPNRMEGPGNGGSPPGSKAAKRTFANLPEDAKAACNKFVAQGLCTQEQYIKEYGWED